MKHSLLYTSFFLTLCLPLLGQTKITFDTSDYSAVSIYDSWERSPFRRGLLKGNAAVIDNPHTGTDAFLGLAPNSTSKVLAMQRSRYGSNMFGARIDLQTPFALTPTPQYVHVLLHRPVSGRVMLIGLGKHREAEWAGQSEETEQFWVVSDNTVTSGKWADAVFAIQGVEGVDIHSLVVVPDCESPHNMTEDFIAYIDQIEVNDNAAPTISYEDYPTNFNKLTTRATRTDRGLLAVSMQGVDTLILTDNPSTGDPLFRERTDKVFSVRAGDTLRPAVSYKGAWMCAYAYIDFGNDGKLSHTLNADGTPAEGSDIISYSAFGKRNSLGQTLADNNTLELPPFVLPADIPAGFYRLRYKVDWDSTDPAGAATIQQNGGAIVDLRLNIHAERVQVREDNRNGDICAGNGSPLPPTIPFGEPLTIRLRPENGFTYSGVRIRHGYNLAGDRLLHGTPQWEELTIGREEFDANDCYTLPAELIDGDVVIEGLFVEQKQ
ncbi:MAG: hypothetical protein J1F13_03845 [Prevotellaceae bacterium]|nr:hypothetical protein [Prevotellaceae bacterium]